MISVMEPRNAHARGESVQTSHESDGIRRDDTIWTNSGPGDIAVSEIISVPKRVESPGKADTLAPGLDGVAATGHNRRRSTRREFDALIRVYGNNLSGNSFYEDARTINVSVHGALLVLNVPVSKGQKLLLFNEGTQRQQVCQIVDIRIRDTESHDVAVAFPVPHAEFWHTSPTRHGIQLHSKIN
jgi:hypothetical protein